MKKRKQHYTPQFLLKNWSSDGHSVIEFLLKTQTYIHNCPIRSQSKKNYYYGKDQKAEDWLAIIEDKASPLIKKLINEELDLMEDEKNVLLFFLAVQYLRTPYFTKKANLYFNAFENSFDPILLCHFKKPDENKRITPEENFEYFRNTAASLFDLKLILLKAKQTHYFVLGQDPLTVINPFLSEIKELRGNHALGIKGIVICLPISPMISLCLYDRHTYFPTIHNGIAQLEDCDIDLLNKYQILKSNDCFYSFDISDRNKIIALSIDKTETFSIKTHSYGPKKDQYTHFSIREYEFPENPLFLRIKAKALSELHNANALELERPGFKQMKNCFEKWWSPDSVTVVGTPLSKEEVRALNYDHH